MYTLLPHTLEVSPKEEIIFSSCRVSFPKSSTMDQNHFPPTELVDSNPLPYLLDKNHHSLLFWKQHCIFLQGVSCPEVLVLAVLVSS